MTEEKTFKSMREFREYFFPDMEIKRRDTKHTIVIIPKPSI
jgi:hypothetical protein